MHRGVLVDEHVDEICDRGNREMESIKYESWSRCRAYASRFARFPIPFASRSDATRRFDFVFFFPIVVKRETAGNRNKQSV